MNTTPRSRLMLVELLCDLVLFALCAVVCVALLVQAQSMSRESHELTRAVYLAQSHADSWQAGGSGGENAVDGFEIQHIQTSGDAGLVSVWKNGHLLYELEVGLP